MTERQLTKNPGWGEILVPEESWSEETGYEQSREGWDLTLDIGTLPKQRLRDWLQRRLLEASRSLADNVEINSNKFGGTPVVRDTRFKIAQLLATLAEGEDVRELADDMDLDEHRLRDILRNLSTMLDQPVKK